VHETRGLQRVICPLVTEVAGGDAAQLPVDNRDQTLEGIAVAVAPGEEQPRHVSWRRRHSVATQVFETEARRVYADA
jgi:hypothetical protein